MAPEKLVFTPHAELQHLADQLIPTVSGLAEHLAADASHAIIAVERHDKDDSRWKNAPPKDRFLWVKAKSSVKISRVKESYEKSHEKDRGSVIHVDIYSHDRPLDVGIRVRDLDCPLNRLVVLIAAEQDLAARTIQPPFGSLGSSDSVGAQTPRLPLHPIGQPNTALPMSSDEDSKRTTWSFDNLPDNSNREVPGHARQSNSQPTVKSPPVDRNAAQLEVVQSVARTEQATAEQSTCTHGLDMDPPASQGYRPREISYNPFESQEDETEISMRGQSLRQLAQDVTPERLEAGVREGVEALAKMREPLEQLQGNADADNWLEQIEKVRQEAVKTRTVVGVVGNTGAGKSSVINALLNEERLVPTNCMRACTAVVTELSYNYSNSAHARYRAEIEFIQPEDWRKELDILVQEVIDEDGRISHEISNPDSQAGIAYAKIRAVYHTHTKEMLTQATVASLMEVKHVKNILGTTKTVTSAQPEVFYRTLQKYVDSKEKGTAKLDKNGKKITNPKREFEHWPLIKVVKIYTKADALSTGAVIVDLPGVHDSNAARAAVAEGYMKQCTGLWIVAPINRAVDDKAAKTLLGSAFKRQLKYDGTYSAVTFICSKTDDISRTEAADSLKLGAEMEEIEEQQGELERCRRRLEKQLKSIRDQKQDHVDALESIEEQLEKWEELKEKAEDGKKIYAPSSPKKSTKKRKRVSKPSLARKKRRSSLDDDDEDDIVSVDSESDDQEPSEDDKTRTPLTKDDVDRRIKELQTLKREARREKGNFDDQIRDLRKQKEDVEELEANLDDRQNELCIAGRNEYSRTAIRQDFAAGIRELDQENAEEEDPDNFDPEVDLRDYDEVGHSLPVFCVSSRAYQQLCGRLSKDNEVAGFTTAEQTEIPQLQAHCKRLTEQGRLATCRRFLNSLDQLVASLGLWASDDGTGTKLTVQQRNAEHGFLDRKLKELEKALQSAVIDKLDDITDTLDENLFEKYRPAIAAAARDALPTATKWGAHRNEGGLHFATYRATIRRNGVYTGASGLQDFNLQLFDPVQKHLASGWEKAFHRRLPNILQTFTKTATELLRKFHAAIEAHCRESGHGVGRMGLLNNQITAYQSIFNDLIAAAITSVNEGQRDINREFVPVITESMGPAYENCSADRGVGVFKRMKGYMTEHVQRQKEAMFHAACEQVRESLAGLVDQVRQQMLDRVDSVYVNMRRDYLHIIGGVNNVQQIQLSREERAVRRDVDDAIAGVEEAFRKVVVCEVEDLKKGGALEEGDDETKAHDEMDVDVEDEFDATTNNDDEEVDEETEGKVDDAVVSEEEDDDEEL